MTSLAAFALFPLFAHALTIRAVPVIERGLVLPVHATYAPDDPKTLYIVEQRGRGRVFRDGKLEPKPFVDLQPKTISGGEMGMLCLVFHPKHGENGFYYVAYTARGKTPTLTVSEMKRGANREKVLLAVPQPRGMHLGGQLAFGPDGFLYIGSGEGGLEHSPSATAQDPISLAGKILKIDVDREGKPEIFAMGFRNPWRFSFDRATGTLWAADVGEKTREEINIVTAGGNFGWPEMEGAQCAPRRPGCDPSKYVLPVYDFPHPGGYSAVIGGLVYRGKKIPALAGAYLYAEYGSGTLYALRYDARAARVRGVEKVLSLGTTVASLAEEPDGEVLVVSHLGRISRLVP